MKAVSRALFAGILGCVLVQPVAAAEEAKFREKVYPLTVGSDPSAGLIDAKGTLYGTTYRGGAQDAGIVFAFDPRTGAETLLHSFGTGADGAYPSAAVIAVHGMLYGTTNRGGADGDGSVFALDPRTHAEKVLHSFAGGEDGDDPLAGLTDMDGTLYGTTGSGGAHVGGTVFSIDPKTGAEKVVYSFCSQAQHGVCADGVYPAAGVIAVKGTLYGTTMEGGGTGCYENLGCGTVFALDARTRVETVLYAFAGDPDGAYPAAAPIYVNGTLYGTTTTGGASDCNIQNIDIGCGAVFALDPKTGAETIVYSFCGLQNSCPDGSAPYGGMIFAKGTLYGATVGGGANGYGTVFALDPGTDAETVLHSFAGGSDGEDPLAGPIDIAGTLYGTTSEGGSDSSGTVFSLAMH